MDFATILYQLREEADMKQSDLADLLNLKPSAISKYERELTQPSIFTIIKIAEIFEVSVDYLLGVSTVKNPYTQEKFSPKETDIILRYRQLSKESKIRLDERISAMLDSQRA